MKREAILFILSFQLSHDYGNIFALRLGREQTVFITGYKLVKEALVAQAQNFADRPYSPLAERIYNGNGKRFFVSYCHCMSSIPVLYLQYCIGYR